MAHGYEFLEKLVDLEESSKAVRRGAMICGAGCGSLFKLRLGYIA